MCHLRPPRVFLRGGFSSSANFDTPNEVCVFGGGGGLEEIVASYI